MRAYLSLVGANFGVGRVSAEVADGNSALVVHHGDQPRQVAAVGASGSDSE